jgi:dienelactone hydrolase
MMDYMPGSYWLSLNVSNALHCGAAAGDVVESCRGARQLLQQGAPDSDEAVIEAWLRGWTGVGSRLLASAEAEAARGHHHSATARRFQAATHFMIAEWLTPFDHADKIGTFRSMRECFRRAVGDCGRGVEFVRIAYQEGVLDGLFVPALGTGGPAPAVIHFNGTHSALEWPYLTGFADRLACRGIASLLFDHPGTGSARYCHGLPLRPDSEIPAAAAFDYLGRRGDVDMTRVGVAGGSMGGYHAPRAAAFDSRISLCLCWGALYELPSWLLDYARGPDDSASAPIHDPGMTQALSRIFGVGVGPDLAAEMGRYTLSGVAERVTCPLYVAHGAEDRQVPLAQAQRLVGEAINATRRRLFVCNDDRGAQHCNLDNLPPALDLLSDCAADEFQSAPSGD